MKRRKDRKFQRLCTNGGLNANNVREATGLLARLEANAQCFHIVYAQLKKLDTRGVEKLGEFKSICIFDIKCDDESNNADIRPTN